MTKDEIIVERKALERKIKDAKTDLEALQLVCDHEDLLGYMYGTEYDNVELFCPTCKALWHEDRKDVVIGRNRCGLSKDGFVFNLYPYGD